MMTSIELLTDWFDNIGSVRMSVRHS